MAKKGWFNEPTRHSLSSRGIRSSQHAKTYVPKLKYKTTKYGKGLSINAYDENMRIANANMIDHSDERSRLYQGIDEPHLYLGIIEVDRDYRNKGIGNDMMQMLIREQERKGLPLYLTPHSPDNSDQHNLIDYYKRYGFSVYGTDKTGNIVMVRRV